MPHRVTGPNVRAAALDEIDRVAGEVRARYLTTVEGQQATYDRKFAQCRAFLDNPGADPDDYPWVRTEMRAQDLDAVAAATLVVETEQSWEPIGRAVEEVRIRAKRLIREVADEKVAYERHAGVQGLLRLLPSETAEGEKALS